MASLAGNERQFRSPSPGAIADVRGSGPRTSLGLSAAAYHLEGNIEPPAQPRDTGQSLLLQTSLSRHRLSFSAFLRRFPESMTIIAPIQASLEVSCSI